MEVLDVSGAVEGVLGDGVYGGGWPVDKFCRRGRGWGSSLRFLCLGGFSVCSCLLSSGAELAPVGVCVDVAAAAFADFPWAGDTSRVSYTAPVVVAVGAGSATLIPRQVRAAALVAGFRIRRRGRPLIASPPPHVVPVRANPASTSPLLNRCSTAGTGVHDDSFPSYGRLQSIVETRILGGVSISALGKQPRYVLWRARRADACSRALSSDDWVKQ